MAGVSPTTISGIESGKITRPHLKTLLKIARALGADVGELRESGKAEAPPSPTQPRFNGLEEERRTIFWEVAVDEAQRLRETGRPRMEEALAAWRASREHGEAPTARRRHLDAMGGLLQHAYDAETALVETLSDTRLAEQWPEVQKADRFYIELWRLVEDAGLSIHTGDYIAAAKHEAVAEGTQLEPTLHIVVEQAA